MGPNDALCWHVQVERTPGTLDEAARGGSEDSAAREQALSETATGCYRLITARLAPTVQRWLRTLSKACRPSTDPGYFDNTLPAGTSLVDSTQAATPLL